MHTHTLRRSFHVALLTALALSLAFGAGMTRRPATAQAAVKIAIMGPFTGNAASIGTEQLNFAKLAVADFNKASQMSVEMVEVDTQLDPAQAITGAQRILADSTIVAVVGPAGSQEVEAVSPLFDPAKIAFVSPSATRPDISEKGVKAFFRVVPRDDVQGPTDAAFMITELKAKKVYVIDDQTSYSTGLADEVEKTLKAMGATSQRDSIKQQDTDFSSLVTRIKGAAPDVVFLPIQIAPQATQIAKQLKEQAVKTVVFGGDGVFSPDDFIKNAAGTTEGAYVSLFAPDIHGIEAAKDIVAAYEKQYGSFGSFGGPAYAATLIALEAVQRASKAGAPTRESVLAEIAKTDQKSSVLGIPMKFDAKGDIIGASFYIYQVKGDKFVLVPYTAPSMAATPAATMAPTQAK